MNLLSLFFFFFKQKTAYDIMPSLVGSEMCIRDRLTLSVLIYIIEFKNWRGWWSKFFDVFGKNPLFIFVLSGVLPRLLGLIRISNGLNPQGKPMYLSPFGW